MAGDRLIGALKRSDRVLPEPIGTTILDVNRESSIVNTTLCYQGIRID